jgi:hypothetical protein
MAIAPDYGDPADWDAIPDAFSAALQQHLEQLGWVVFDAHDDAVIVDAPGLDEDEQWYLGRPNFHGWWCYGVAIKGYCANPERLYVDPTDPEAIALAADKILRARRTD